MNELSIATWNIHQAKSFDGSDGFSVSPAALASDIICIQEVPYDIPEDFMSLRHLYCWYFEQNPNPTRFFPGIGIASNHCMLNTEHCEFPAPEWSVDKRVKSVQPHRKGALICKFKLPWGQLSLACVHLLPPSIFGVDESGSEALQYLAEVADALLNSDPDLDLIVGDFNCENRMDVFGKHGFTSLTQGTPTRRNGRSHDDILVKSTAAYKVGECHLFDSDSDHCIVTGSLSIY